MGSHAQRLADFESVVARHRSYLMRIAVASTRNPADAEDVVQEALLRGYRGLEKFRGDCPLHIWLARIVVRVSINYRRSLIRHVRRWVMFSDLVPPESSSQEQPFDAPAPEAGVAPEVLLDVGRHVNKLPDEFRIPLLMFASDGMTISEIASVLEIPEGTVKSRIFYGRIRLRKGLKL